ncbi:MAG: hypothetical protein CMF99_01450 [Candidatus Marinimicrobia bacterium]|nr:hypothetical protein [Candidatus Neomarinimicrobiota bacterium]
MMIKSLKIFGYKTLLLLFVLYFNEVFPKDNKLFWDGRDWNRVKKIADYNTNYEFIIKKAYLEGVLDGRLFSYLKTWENNKVIADNVFSETVDYLTIRELIKNIDHFYNDPMNSYIPIPSAVLIANMYAKRMNMENIDLYIKSTRKWINELTLDLDTLNYSKLLEQKVIKHNND